MQRPLKSDVDPAASRGMRRWFFLATAVFHALLFAYVLLRIQPALDYARSGPLFFRNRAFLRSYLEYPGGPLDLAATALAQFGFSNQAGALCFTLLAGLVFLVVLSGWRSIVNRRAAMEPFVAAFLLLLARQENHVQSLTAGLGVVLSWGMAVAYSRLPGRLGWWRSVFPVLASPAIFIVGGPWPCALFLLGVLLFETPPTRRWAVALVGLVAGISAVLAAAGKPDLAKFF
ncbi:MAG TPA: DUF6057 family protein, partial [Candidatus Paceibacterota bacterium]|nr:DUF6057 family protein [Candidatus Paceibacterota bacterium]